ncbi:RNA-guided endonuclease InsQ/TnpB family protein [Lentzea aerocolonigenes]|uniref:RNA-guided endonuclease InsQ/TnpB family protein n=1 Tax=Lentzea aerocolonigenes TaxID=68170 RepID=UPI0018C891E9|nr:RNA-guided endonuclease TnpB family protein [Lentzea aerocolonigenes]
MKLAVQVKLLPTAEQTAALRSTLYACNDAADAVSQMAFETGVFREYALRKPTYAAVKARGLGAQAAQHVIKKVADAYTALHASIRNGNLGPEAGKRRVKAKSKPIRFRSDAAQPFDDRCLSWHHDAGTVSIWTVAGRVKNLRFAGSPDQLRMLRAYRRGETDLAYRDGNWLLIATCEIEEKPEFDPADWVGVDRGIVNLATTSDVDNFQGCRLQRYRRWHARKRAELQARRTKSARRRLKRRSRREARHATHLNHRIAKQIVAVAERTGRGIALEDLGGIRDRVTVSRHQRATLTTWPFHQLEQHIRYKARRAGVPVLTVDARYTSQMCPRCRHTERANRPSRDQFCCRRCGLAGPADVVAAVNVRNRARSVWVHVNVPDPIAAEQPSVDAARTRAASRARGTRTTPGGSSPVPGLSEPSS